MTHILSKKCSEYRNFYWLLSVTHAQFIQFYRKNSLSIRPCIKQNVNPHTIKKYLMINELKMCILTLKQSFAMSFKTKTFFFTSLFCTYCNKERWPTFNKFRIRSIKIASPSEHDRKLSMILSADSLTSIVLRIPNEQTKTRTK